MKENIMKNMALIGLIAMLGGCSPALPPLPEKLNVSTTFYPLTFLAKRIGADAAIVTQVVPGATEPHDFEPTPQEVSAVYNSKVFLLNGAGLEPWAEDITEELDEKGIAVIRATEGMESGNPHIWLDPVSMKAITLHVRDAFLKADPAHARVYKASATKLIYDLDALHAYFKTKLKKCARKRVIVSHDAFGHLAKRYGFETLSVAGLSPDEEPSPKIMADIINTAKREKVTVIFSETLASPKLAEAVARGANAEVRVLNPLEGLTPEEEAAGRDYLSIMRENAGNLAIALQCKR